MVRLEVTGGSLTQRPFAEKNDMPTYNNRIVRSANILDFGIIHKISTLYTV